MALCPALGPCGFSDLQFWYMCTGHTHIKCKLNSCCIGFSLAPSVNLDCETVSTVSGVLRMVSTGLPRAVCHCLAADASSQQMNRL